MNRQVMILPVLLVLAFIVGVVWMLGTAGRRRQGGSPPRGPGRLMIGIIAGTVAGTLAGALAFKAMAGPRLNMTFSLVFVLIAGLVVMLVLSALRGGKAGKIALGIIGGVVLLGVLAMFFWAKPQSVPVTALSPPDPVASAEVQPGWELGAEIEWPADVYPSAQAAEQAGRPDSYVDKPWAADFARWVNTRQGLWRLAQNPRPASSAAEARQAAEDQARATATEVVMATTDHRLRPMVEQVIRERLVAGTTDSLVQDRFVQRFDRPYGAVYREAILLDLSGPQSAAITMAAYELQMHQDALARSERVSRLGHLGSGLAMLALIGVLYGWLNAATHGYYKWALRTLALAVGMAVLLLALNWW